MWVVKCKPKESLHKIIFSLFKLTHLRTIQTLLMAGGRLSILMKCLSTPAPHPSIYLLANCWWWFFPFTIFFQQPWTAENFRYVRGNDDAKMTSRRVAISYKMIDDRSIRVAFRESKSAVTGIRLPDDVQTCFPSIMCIIIIRTLLNIVVWLRLEKIMFPKLKCLVITFPSAERYWWIMHFFPRLP